MLGNWVQVGLIGWKRSRIHSTLNELKDMDVDIDIES